MNRGFYSAVSGLNSARTGLYVTGHNMANTSTVGYVRQQVLSNDFTYQGIGGNMSVGLGTDVTMIRQIRNEYLDINFRKEVGKVNFYNIQYGVGNEIENILGELQSQYSTQKIITQDLWASLQELNIKPEGPETRGNFVSTAYSYITKMNNIYERLTKEQNNLNDDIKTLVTRINQLTTKIQEMNIKISGAEASGQQANDYRDERNLCLDELAKYIKIEYHENAKGQVDVFTNGHELVSNGWVNQIGLRYSCAGSTFVEPVFSSANNILEYDSTGQNAKSLFSFYGSVGSDYGNDYGELFSLIVARGLYPVDYTSVSKIDPALAVPPAMPAITLNGTTHTYTGTYPPVTDAEYAAVNAWLQTVPNLPDYAAATSADKDIFDGFKSAYEEHLPYAWAQNFDTDMLYPPAVPENNMADTVFTLSPTLQAEYDLLYGTGAYAADSAAVQTILNALPNPNDYAMGVYDQNYINAVKTALSHPDMKTYLGRMEGFFKDASAASLAASEFNQQYADFKVFRDGVKSYSADMERLTAELAAQPLNYRNVEFNLNQCTIPKAMRQLDELFHYMITMINEELSKGYDLNKCQSQTKVFVTKDGSSRFTMGNVEVNPDLMDPEGYNLLCLGDGSGQGSDTYIVSLLEKWSEMSFSIDGVGELNIERAYSYIVNQIGVKTNNDLSYYKGEAALAGELDNKRSQISGVSLDEEMKNMMIYQHAFNAASRIITVLDQMIDQVVNRTGRVGL